MSTLLIDSSFIAYSKMFNCKKESTSEEGYGMWRYYYMNDIFKYIKKFDDITEVIIAQDAGNYWRRDIFPWYKKQRKLSRDNQEKKDKAEEHWFRWDEFYTFQNEFIECMKKYLPVKVLKVDRTEADDIIAILVRHIKGNKYIVTSDHDYIQLLKYDNVKIFSPQHKVNNKRGNYLTSDNPRRDMFIKIMSGDKSDFIPSINDKHTYKSEFLEFCVLEKMADNLEFAKIKLDNDEKLLYEMYFKFSEKYNLTPTRKRTFTEKMAKHHYDENNIKELLNEDVTIKKNFKRNNKLVNLDLQPDHIVDKVIEDYENYKLPNVSMGFLKFCRLNKFRQFINQASELTPYLKRMIK